MHLCKTIETKYPIKMPVSRFRGGGASFNKQQKNKRPTQQPQLLLTVYLFQHTFKVATGHFFRLWGIYVTFPVLVFSQRTAASMHRPFPPWVLVSATEGQPAASSPFGVCLGHKPIRRGHGLPGFWLYQGLKLMMHQRRSFMVQTGAES